MSKKRKNFMKQATDLHSKAVRARDGRCLAAGAHGIECKGYLQACHIEGRGELVIRTNEKNAIAMCQAHHRFFTGRTAAWRMWVEEAFPGRQDYLQGLVREWYEAGCPKVDWEAERDRLRELCKELEAA